MQTFLQVLIIILAILGLYVMITEIAKIYGKNHKPNGRIYILCVPQTNNIEEFCAETLSLYRRNGFGEDILICSEKLSEEEKNIGRLIKTADKGIYFIEPEDLPQIVR